MLTRWDLNSIALQHTNRFFLVAAQVIRDLPLNSNETNLALKLAGNLIWAKSPYTSDDDDQNHNMAMLGALLGTLSEKLVPEHSDAKTTLLLSLANLEAEFTTLWDPMLDSLLKITSNLAPEQSSPSQINQLVWESLFPQHPYPQNNTTLYLKLHKQLLELHNSE